MPTVARHEPARTRELRRGDSPLQENPAYTLADLRQRSTPEIEGYDGRELRNAQVELRALRADVAELARALGRPLRNQSCLTEFRGIIQQFDQFDSDTQRRWFDGDRARAVSPRREVAAELRQVELRQLARKQEALLEALRRAQQHLEEAPDLVLPPGVREAVIGEILRARYSAALFGGLSGSALTTGRLANALA